MASNRHLGRVVVLQSLYEYELRTMAHDPEVDLDVIVAKNIRQYERTLGDTEFVYTLAHNVVEACEALDTALQPMAPEWPIASISAIDRNVLRMGLYELSECRDSVPPKVAINEAVELAKSFGSENSSRFVNGVLGTAYKQLGIVEEENDESEEESTEEVDATERVEPDEQVKSSEQTESSGQAEPGKQGQSDEQAGPSEPATSDTKDGAEQ